MVELSFITGGEIMSFKIIGKEIWIRGKGSNYTWAPWDPLGLNGADLSRLRAKYGEKWYKNYMKAEKKFESFETEKEVAKDLIEDMQKSGWRLIKKK